MNPKDQVQLSKGLSYVLRHGAGKEGIELDGQGYAAVGELLQRPQFRRFAERDVEAVVAGNDKQRFALRRSASGRLFVRANQGHSIALAAPDLRPVTDPSEFPVVVHGTQWRLWDDIRKDSLSRMRRTHIHFAQGFPGEDGVISGMRGNCDLFIYADMAAALSAGLSFSVSANGVLLCAGDDRGFLRPEFFHAAERRLKDGSRQNLQF